MRTWMGLMAAAMLMFSGVSQAASLQVSPIRVDIPSDDVSRPLWAANTGSEPIHVQIQVFRWTQVNGQDVLEPTTDVIATPAMTEVVPGGKQLIRLVRQVDAPASEQAYRLRVEELPKKKSDSKNKPALNLLLAYSLPVFLNPVGTQMQEDGKSSKQKKTTHLDIQATSSDVTITNNGPSRVMISDLAAVTADGSREVVRSGLVGYVLAGQTMVFAYKAAAGTISVGATVDQDEQLTWTIAP